MHADKHYPLWHPYSSLLEGMPRPEVQRASGSKLYLENGRVLLDMISSWWVTLHGHAQPEIAAAIGRQAMELEQVIFAGFVHQPALQLATELIHLLPGKPEKVFYSDNGSTAVEVGIKMALQYWRNRGETERKTIVAFEEAYHGDTFGAMSVSGRSAFNAAFNDFLFQVKHLPIPTDENIADLEWQFEEILQQDPAAAFLFEPLVQGAAGMRMYRAEPLERLLRVAKRYRVLLIADEVMTGFGRTGTYFAMDQVRIAPDIICLSKGLTGGFMPMGATTASSEVAEAFRDSHASKTLYHGHSYTANPLGCAAGLASLALLKSETCRRQIQEMVQRHADFVQAFKHDSRISNLRQCGTILAFELNTPEEDSYFNPVKQKVMQYAMEHGVLLRPLGNTLYLLPPYGTAKEELTTAYRILEKCIEKFGVCKAGA